MINIKEKETQMKHKRNTKPLKAKLNATRETSNKS